MGVKIGASGYQSQMAAELAAKQALAEFFEALEKEVRRKR